MVRADARSLITQSVHTHLDRLEPDERVCGMYRVQHARARRRNDGAIFHEVTLADCSGSVIAYAWPETLRLDVPLPRHALVSVEFVTRQFADGLVADLRAIEVVPASDPVNVLELLPRHQCPEPQWLDRFIKTAQGLHSEVLQGFLQRVLAQEDVALAFVSSPCLAIPARGGLLQYAVRSAYRVSRMSFSRVEWFELATVATLLSEIGDVTSKPKPSQRREERTMAVCASALEWLDHEYRDAAVHFRHLWSGGLIACGPQPNVEVIAAVELVRSMDGAAMANKRGYDGRSY